MQAWTSTGVLMENGFLTMPKLRNTALITCARHVRVQYVDVETMSIAIRLLTGTQV